MKINEINVRDFSAPVCKLFFPKAFWLCNNKIIFILFYFYNQDQLRSDRLKQFPVCFAALVAPHIASSDSTKHKIMIF